MASPGAALLVSNLAHAPSSGAVLTQWHWALISFPFCLSAPMEPTSECLTSTLICETEPFGFYVSEWDTEGELMNSVSWTGVGLGTDRGKPRQAKGQVAEVIAGWVECPCVHSKNDYMSKGIYMYI